MKTQTKTPSHSLIFRQLTERRFGCTFLLFFFLPFLSSFWRVGGGGVSAQNQNIGINTDGSAPETGVMLDVKIPTAKATTSVVATYFQIKSFDANADALKLRLGFKTDATAANRYGFIDFSDFTLGTPTYLNLILQPSGGNVGIGTINPVAKFEVVGNVKITDGTQLAGNVLTSDATGLATWAVPSGVPSGAVMFFDLATCPTGWTELIAAQGRYMVGLPAGGTLNGTVGTALTNIENRDVAQHSHSAIASSDGSHIHTITDPGHFHSVVIRHMGNGTFTNENYANTSGGSDETRFTDSKTTGITINSSGTHTHTVSINSAGTILGTNAPYIQLRVCKKN